MPNRGSGARAHVVQLSGDDPLLAGGAKSIRAVYFNVGGGFATSKGTEGWPTVRGRPNLLGWVKPPPNLDSTKPVELKVAVLRLPLLVLRELPLGG